MTATTIDAVGFCAHYSTQGDWAFEFALELARKHGIKLNIFHFLGDPYNPRDTGPIGMNREQFDGFLIEREKELRLYYDTRLGDYLEAGFRLCEDNEWTELHRCLCKREFQVLVLGFPQPDAVFWHRPIREFAAAFVCPVILVGPDSPDEISLNSPAALLAEKLGLENLSWRRIGPDGTWHDAPATVAIADRRV